MSALDLLSTPGGIRTYQAKLAKNPPVTTGTTGAQPLPKGASIDEQSLEATRTFYDTDLGKIALHNQGIHVQRDAAGNTKLRPPKPSGGPLEPTPDVARPVYFREIAYASRR